MRLSFHREQLPWMMAYSRALLGPVIAFGESARWSGSGLATLVIAALFSDIFDGILARRWRSDTAGLRLLDSMADTVFFTGAAVALCLGRPHLWRTHALLLSVLIALEAGRLLFDFAKFGKPASYHSYLAKSWGLVLAGAVVAAFWVGHANALMSAALVLGIVCNVEGAAMSVVLPAWRRDVKSLRAAWMVRESGSASNFHPLHANTGQ